MALRRRKAREIRIGSVYIGGQHPVAIQSMAKSKTSDVNATVKQARQLEKAGCEIIRLAVVDEADAKALGRIKQSVGIPLVADIHFNWRLALAAIESGVDKIRLNPGNIYRLREIREIVKAAKSAGIPIRVGVNSGSLRSEKPRAGMSEAMVESALDYARIIEGFGFGDIVISLKASNIVDTVAAYQKIAKLCDYPLHLGVTATGPAQSGIVKSTVAIGSLLLDGIGDTIRVSLTDKPEEEVRIARYILESLDKRCAIFEIISCPTCGRCEVDLRKIVGLLEKRLSGIGYKPLARSTKLAVMGCMVNGPGEAKECDVGIAFAKKEGLLFKAGRAVRKIPLEKCVDVLLKEIIRQK